VTSADRCRNEICEFLCFCDSIIIPYVFFLYVVVSHFVSLGYIGPQPHG
jgi:hypothetical protein